MKKLLLSAAGLAVVATAFSQTNSEDNYGSLVPKTYHNPYIGRTARAEGDILTIVVSEITSAHYSASTVTSKKDSNSVDPLKMPLLRNLPLLNQLFGGLSSGASSATNGQGTTTQTGALTAKISVIVKQVLPNGNMVVEGTRWIKVNKENENVTFTGIVRHDDVRSDNTVLSENVAEAKITSLSKGVIADRQRRGILTRILDWLF